MSTISPETFDEDARLIILKELAAQPNGTLHSSMLQLVLRNFGHRWSRDWVHTQLYQLAEVGGVRLIKNGSVIIASITQAGYNHVQRNSVLAGVALPSPAV